MVLNFLGVCVDKIEKAQGRPNLPMAFPCTLAMTAR